MATAKKTASPSTAVAVKKSTSVVSVKEMMAAQLAAMAGKTAPAGGNKIRVTQDKQFILPDGTKTPGPIQAVVLDFTSMNTWYENEFDKNTIVPPNCFAIGDIPTKLMPSANSPDKQGDEDGNCAGCPMNAWGSGKNGGKACKNSRVLAVIVPGEDTTPEDAPIWTIQTSPTAIKGFDGYVKNVQRMFGTPPIGVVTSISFDENQTYATLVFSDPVPNEDVGACFGRLEEAREVLATEPDVSSFGQTAPAKKAAPARRPATARR